MNCYIVDDAPSTVEYLVRYIGKVPYLRLVGVEQDPEKALAYLLDTGCEIDLVFLDIEMPQTNGLDIARAIRGKYLYIFSSGHDEFGPEAFALQATFYLRKPSSFSEFMKAVEIAKEIFTKPRGVENSSPSLPMFIPGNGKSGLVRADTKDILYIKSDKNYVKVFTLTDIYHSYLTITALEEYLRLYLFARIHRSYLVNIRKIKKLDALTVTMGDGASMPISQSYREEFMKQISEFRP